MALAVVPVKCSNLRRAPHFRPVLATPLPSMLVLHVIACLLLWVASGSILLVAAIIGTTYSTFKKFADCLNLVFLGRTTFFSIQKEIVLPVIQAVWTAEKKRVKSILSGEQYIILILLNLLVIIFVTAPCQDFILFDSLDGLLQFPSCILFWQYFYSSLDFPFLPCCNYHSAGRDLVLADDGRYDSPGYTAKFGTYTLMDVETNLIVDFQVCQCTDTTSSVAMEKLGFETVLARCKAEGLKITTMVTDRSLSIKKFLRGEPDINHQFWCLALCQVYWVKDSFGCKAEGLCSPSTVVAGN